MVCRVVFLCFNRRYRQVWIFEMPTSTSKGLHLCRAITPRSRAGKNHTTPRAEWFRSIRHVKFAICWRTKMSRCQDGEKIDTWPKQRNIKYIHIEFLRSISSAFVYRSVYPPVTWRTNDPQIAGERGSIPRRGAHFVEITTITKNCYAFFCSRQNRLLSFWLGTIVFQFEFLL